HKEVEHEVQEASDRALEAAPPAKESITRFVYSPDLDPTSSACETQPAVAPVVASTDGEPKKAPAPKTMADLINSCLKDEMRRDERIVILGATAAECSRGHYICHNLI